MGGTEIWVSHCSISFPPGDLNGGICRLWRASLKRWRLPNLISMLLWSSVNLPNSRLCLLLGQIGWDWCCCCGFRLSASVVRHYAVIQHPHAREMDKVAFSNRHAFFGSQFKSILKVAYLAVHRDRCIVHLIFLTTPSPLCCYSFFAIFSPSFVSCRACLEDRLLVSLFMMV